MTGLATLYASYRFARACSPRRTRTPPQDVENQWPGYGAALSKLKAIETNGPSRIPLRNLYVGNFLQE